MMHQALNFALVCYNNILKYRFLFVDAIELTILIIVLLRWRFLGAADKIFGTLLIFNALTELLATVLIYTVKRNIMLYNLHDPLELILIILYFNKVVQSVSKYGSGKLLCIVAILLAIFVYMFLQPLSEYGTVYICFESLIILALCTWSVFSYFRYSKMSLFRRTDFWLISIMLFFWASNAFYFGLCAQIFKADFFHVVYLNFYIIYAITHLGYFLVFLFYKKLIPSVGNNYDV